MPFGQQGHGVVENLGVEVVSTERSVSHSSYTQVYGRS